MLPGTSTTTKRHRMMSDEWTEYEPPEAVELFAEPVPDCDGPVWPVGECGDDVFPHAVGGTPNRSPLAWGEDGMAPDGAVWVKVDELDSALTTQGGERVEVWAAWVDGRLFLHVGDEPESVGGDDVESAGGGLVCEVDEVGMPHDVGRVATPDITLVAFDGRDAFLNDADGKWHADYAWDIVGCLSYQTQAPGPGGAVNVSTTHYRNLTLWAVTCGNLLAFMSTATDAGFGHGVTMDAKNWDSFGSLMRCYGHDPQDEYAGTNPGLPGWWNSQFNAGTQIDAIDVITTFPAGFTNVAWLPWQNAGEAAVFADNDWAEQNCGTMNSSSVDDAGCVVREHASMVADSGIFFCPRLHVCGDRLGGCMAFSRAQVGTILYGGPDDFGEWFPDLYTLWDDRGQAQHFAEPAAFQLLYNPWAVEGLGLSSTDSYGFLRRSAAAMLPAAAPGWKRVCSALLRCPVDDVYWEIAGAEVDGCLLTASCCTNYVS